MNIVKFDITLFQLCHSFSFITPGINTRNPLKQLGHRQGSCFGFCNIASEVAIISVE
jgi:hypothetical protein